jgi:hypothetical protein
LAGRLAPPPCAKFSRDALYIEIRSTMFRVTFFYRRS